MSSHERDSRIGVVGRTPGLDLLRPLSEEEKIERGVAIAESTAEAEMKEMEVEVHHRDPATMAAILGTLEANGISTRLPEPPKKVPKERPSDKEQARRIAAAEAKRERRKQRRLREGT